MKVTMILKEQLANNSTNNMETKDLKKKFKDLTVAKLTMDAVYSRRAIEEMVTKQFGNSVLRYLRCRVFWFSSGF